MARMRRSNGRFRKATLRDFGMASCDRCGAIYTPDLSKLTPGFIDPIELNRLMKQCPRCDGAKTDGNVFVPVND